MFYKVRARLKKDTAIELQCRLLDGTIRRQQRDGREIVASMQRAVVTDSGDIEWSEVCYCPSPLRHERTTVYDHYFNDLSTELVEGYQRYEGRPFMTYLKELTKAARQMDFPRPAIDQTTSTVSPRTPAAVWDLGRTVYS